MLATSTAHGSSKPVRVRRFVVIRPAVRRPSVRSPPKRRPTCPRVLTRHRPRHLAHLTLSAPCRVGHEARIRPVIRRPRRWRPTPCCHRFPVAFRRTGIRFWVILSRYGVQRPLRSAYRSRLGMIGPHGVSTFPTHELRPGWAPPLPRQRRCSYGRKPVSRPPPAALQRRGCYHPARTSHPRGFGLRGINRGSLAFARPVFPSPVAPGMEPGTLGLEP